MEITFDSAALAQQLSAAGRVLNSKIVLPILDCFLLEVADTGDSLTITASDSENTVQLTCPLISFVPDEDASCTRFCVKSRLVMDALKEIPSQPVTFIVDMQTMNIRGSYMGGTFTMFGESSNTYPAPPTPVPDAQELTVSARMLMENIASASFALADDELRPVMGGIFFDLTPGGMTCVGTDGRKMVRRCTAAAAPHLTMPFPEGAAYNINCGFILPKKTSNLLRALLSKVDGDVQIRFTETHLWVRADGFTLAARLIDGHYPNYNSVIPQNNPYVAEVERSLLLPAVRRVLTCANKDLSLVKLSFAADGLTLTTQDIDSSTSATEKIPVVWNGPASFTIGVKGNILLEILTYLPEQILITMSEPERAMIFTPVEQEEYVDVLMLLMPMKI